MDRLATPRDLWDPRERMSIDELRSHQLGSLRSTLERVYANIPHYTTAFDNAGVRAADLHELSDLAAFPLTSKADLRDNYPFGMFAVPREDVVRVHASSGTTGRPTVVGYTAEDISDWADVMARSIRAAGAARVICSMWPTGMASSPAGSARTTELSGWAARSCR